ncbi:hypothetical protein [Candidatus Chlorohelix sp.]|uniref:hypothetical protein n=1 Tax=Candidatus Chlorohelix sp. TaxID=3139201 RepID=UPI0030629ECE
MNNEQRVIAYVPKDVDDRPASDMGAVRRGLWMYTHKLGLNFSLVLLLSLAYQAFVAVFIAMKGLRSIPIFDNLLKGEQFLQIIGTIGVIVIAIVIQGLIIAEMAQVVWLRHPDRLKVRLMRGSIWWWIMLVTLLPSIAIDFMLLFLSVTEQTNLDSALRYLARDQVTGLTILLLSILNFLTLLRCASVMRTSTSEEIRREVEERLNAIAEEMLIDAGDSARSKTAKVWKQLSVNPQRFVPIHDSVVNLISQNHPELVPPDLGGDAWAYDFSGNTFAALPPDVHMALLQNRYRASNTNRSLPAGNRIDRTVKKPQTEQDENQLLWKLPPSAIAEMISYNLETYGKPRFVDITEPDAPKYLTRPLELSALGIVDEHNQLSQGKQPTLLNSAATQQIRTINAPVSHIVTGGDFLSTISPKEKALFGAYLAKTVFPHVHGNEYMPSSGADIYQIFDELELQWYYRYWRKHFSEGVNSSQIPVPPAFAQ